MQPVRFDRRADAFIKDVLKVSNPDFLRICGKAQLISNTIEGLIRAKPQLEGLFAYLHVLENEFSKIVPEPLILESILNYLGDLRFFEL